MNRLKLGALCAIAALATATSASAQPYNGNRATVSSWNSGWDRDAFWRGSPDNLLDRIAFMQQRIDRGVADGTINRAEGYSSQRELQRIRWDVQRLRGRMDDGQRVQIQARLDNLGSRIRWQRQNGAYRAGGGYDSQRAWAPEDRRYVTDYDATRYYRDGPNYRERVLSRDDEVYRGSDGRYYCKRSDGTTGLVIGAVGGAAIGNVIDGGHERLAGTLIGGALGALAGQAIDRSGDVRCR